MPRYKPFAERFWDKVQKTDGCWIWTGKKNWLGYGTVYIGPHHFRAAHRVAYELAGKGIIPQELKCLHKCDNPPCCNPEHLFIGTQQDNMDDMMSKKRHFHHKNPEQERINGTKSLAGALQKRIRHEIMFGEEHPNAKLTAEKVRMIRSLREQGMKYKDIKKIVGVGTSTIGRVLTKETSGGGWVHII